MKNIKWSITDQHNEHAYYLKEYEFRSIMGGGVIQSASIVQDIGYYRLFNQIYDASTDDRIEIHASLLNKTTHRFDYFLWTGSHKRLNKKQVILMNSLLDEDNPESVFGKIEY